MTRFEYKLVPAPTRGVRAKGVKTAEGRFAHAVEAEINARAAQGWEYLRADTLPHEERQGLTGTATSFRTLLVFRRAVASADPDPGPVTEDPGFPLPSVLTARDAPDETSAQILPTEAVSSLRKDDTQR